MKRLFIILAVIAAFNVSAIAVKPADKAKQHQVDKADATGEDEYVAYSDTTAVDTVVTDPADADADDYGMPSQSIDFNMVGDPFHLFAFLAHMGVSGVFISVLVVIFGILFFLSPFIFVAVLVYLNSRNKRRRYELIEKAIEKGQPLPQDLLRSKAESKEAMWESGVKQFFIGLGLVILFYVVGGEELCGIGALVALYGAGKAVAARTSSDWKRRKKPEDDIAGNGEDMPEGGEK